MKRVQIYERDTTVVDAQTLVTDVVYVPGFATGTTKGDSKPVIKLAAPRVPTYCATIEDFHKAFGADAPYFKFDQAYPVWSEEKDVPETYPEYDETSTYAVGDKVTYDGGSYQCSTAVETPEAWDSTKWTSIEPGVIHVDASDGFTEDALPGTGGDESSTDVPTMFKAFQVDPSYVYATELLLAGLPVVYERINIDDSDILVETMYSAFKDSANGVFNPETSPLLDKNGLSVKYLTSGGYPTYEYKVGESESTISNQMQMLAANRGDCIAFIDHTDNPERPLTGEQSIYGDEDDNNLPSIRHDSVGSYSTMITPWVAVSRLGSYTTTAVTSRDIFATVDAPGSFAYLSALASSLKTNANWLAIAGVARGRVPSMIQSLTNEVMTNTIAENMTPIYGVAINPITNIRPYGECIWGNRTLLDTTTKSGYATGFLNIRNLVCDVKKQAYVAAMSCMFEQNTDVLWINFKSMIQPLLEQMRTGAGLKNYKIIKLPGSERETIRAKIVLVPVYAVEQFIIDVYITDSDVALEEVSEEV